jgi:hypothetical protein
MVILDGKVKSACCWRPRPVADFTISDCRKETCIMQQAFIDHFYARWLTLG